MNLIHLQETLLTLFSFVALVNCITVVQAQLVAVECPWQKGMYVAKICKPKYETHLCWYGYSTKHLMC